MYRSIFFDGSTALNSICYYDKERDYFQIVPISMPKTNNELEYMSLLRAVEYVVLQYRSLRDIKFYGDSELIIKQMKGEYQVKQPHLKMWRNKIITLCASYQHRINVNEFNWVPREENLAGVILEDELYKKKRRGIHGTL